MKKIILMILLISLELFAQEILTGDEKGYAQGCAIVFQYSEFTDEVVHCTKCISQIPSKKMLHNKDVKNKVIDLCIEKINKKDIYENSK